MGECLCPLLVASEPVPSQTLQHVDRHSALVVELWLEFHLQA
jgi:hypothetical protein